MTEKKRTDNSMTEEKRTDNYMTEEKRTDNSMTEEKRTKKDKHNTTFLKDIDQICFNLSNQRI
jgi:hypothetical protein